MFFFYIISNKTIIIILKSKINIIATKIHNINRFKGDSTITLQIACSSSTDTVIVVVPYFNPVIIPSSATVAISSSLLI